MANQDEQLNAGVVFANLAQQMTAAAAASGEASQSLANQMVNLTSAIGAHGISQHVETFEGDSSKFKDWMKSIDKYALLTGLTDDRKKFVAYQSSRGGVSDFINREINTPGVTWGDLKKELTARFAEISDPMQAFSLLRKVKQKYDENVQLFGERILALARDAFAGQDPTLDAVQRQLIGFFVDGLHHDYLRIKVMRESPATFEAAVKSALNEQNLRKRFHLRSGREYGRPQSGVSNNTRQEIPMEVDHLRPSKRCFKCNKKGHIAARCRVRPERQVNVIYERQPRQARQITCWSCGQLGHIRARCPNLAQDKQRQEN
ncbi:MAG: hypothetical protein N0C90_00440 [Candidatus Thiodiazotropha endolucinida]|nr:hypothetical protein [Candidatus Thiodiazotropha taylori]MCG8046483.1 hypothetical protein [Candidatus Thiodiazotropha taylori]MCW4259813.1 hypothetical protein [Candidatus Thiodiazotropha endolucinida]MCW4344194.1 hypothetical protein [Candidatus Thiodiazotropha endolucinida]